MVTREELRDAVRERYHHLTATRIEDLIDHAQVDPQRLDRLMETARQHGAFLQDRRFSILGGTLVVREEVQE